MKQKNTTTRKRQPPPRKMTNHQTSCVAFFRVYFSEINTESVVRRGEYSIWVGGRLQIPRQAWHTNRNDNAGLFKFRRPHQPTHTHKSNNDERRLVRTHITLAPVFFRYEVQEGILSNNDTELVLLFSSGRILLSRGETFQRFESE